MKRILLALTILFFLLASCSDAASEDENARKATFTLLLNDIRARITENAALEPATLGASLRVGGQALSGENSRARLDLTPDGTIIRIGPNTLFTLEELGTDPANPSAKLRLDFGQLWIILNGGSLDVESDYGDAAVRGSYMSVAFDPAIGLTITCLEGHCDLSNDAGTVNLTSGQTSSILQQGEPPSPPAEMDTQAVQDWQAASPEAEELLNPSINQGPRTTQDGMPIPEKAEVLNTASLQFALANNCPGSLMTGDWLWQFERLPDENGTGFVEHISVPGGQTVNGTLPPGQYVVTDWFPDGTQHGPQLTMSDMAFLNVQACPDGGGPVNPPPGDFPQPLNPSPTPR